MLAPKLKRFKCWGCAAPLLRPGGYDHRDYRRPLAVEPVCRKCNQRRGPAAWRESTVRQLAARHVPAEV